MSDKFNSDKAPEPVGLYPHARRVGELLFLSGVGPREKGTKVIPGVTLDDDGNIIAYNIETQCRSVFNNVKLILEASGSSWNELVDVTVFLTNMKADFRTYNRIYAEYFKDNQPCRTTVEINSLPTPIAIELKCMATVKAAKKAPQYEKIEEPAQQPSSTTTKPISEVPVETPKATPIAKPESIIEKPTTTPVRTPSPEPERKGNKPTSRTQQW